MRLECLSHFLAQVLLGIERKFHHAFQKTLGGQAGEILVHQFLDIQAADVAQLDGLVARCVYEIPVRIVDDDQIPCFFKARAPEFPGRPLE
jgi:hypothetical protein